MFQHQFFGVPGGLDLFFFQQKGNKWLKILEKTINKWIFLRRRAVVEGT